MCKFIVLKWLGFFGHTFHLSSSISSHFLCFWGPWPRRSEPIYPARLMPSLGAGCRSEMCIQSVCKRTLHLVSTSEIRSFGDEKWWRFSFHRTVTNVLARAWDERTNFRWICNDFLLFTSIPVHFMGPDSNIWWPDLSISGVGCGPALARRCFQAGFAFQRWRLKSLTFGKCFQSRIFVTVSDTYVHWIGINVRNVLHDWPKQSQLHQFNRRHGIANAIAELPWPLAVPTDHVSGAFAFPNLLLFVSFKFIRNQWDGMCHENK